VRVCAVYVCVCVSCVCVYHVCAVCVCVYVCVVCIPKARIRKIWLFLRLRQIGFKNFHQLQDWFRRLVSQIGFLTTRPHPLIIPQTTEKTTHKPRKNFVVTKTRTIGKCVNRSAKTTVVKEGVEPLEKKPRRGLLEFSS